MIILCDLFEEFASMKITKQKNDFAKLSILLVPIIFELYKKSIKTMLDLFKQLINNNNTNNNNNIDMNTVVSITSLTNLCVKSMRILLERSIECKFDKNSPVCYFFFIFYIVTLFIFLSNFEMFL